MHRVKRTFHIVLAAILILIGIAGLILPVLDGMLFLLLGFIILSFESPYIDTHLTKLAHKYDFIGKWYDKLNAWMRKIFGP